MAEPLACLNGQFLPQGKARLELHDAGFIFGATATDMCRTFHHRLYRWPDHLARFQHSCRYACIPQPLAHGELTELAERLVAHNAALLAPEQDLALVLFATPGPIGYYAGKEGGEGAGPPTLGMHTFPLSWRRHAPFFREGVHLVVPATRHVPPECIDPRAKQRSRLPWWRAEQEARHVEPGAVALVLDANGQVTETAGANFLLVKDGVVLSPPRRAILGGISLQTVEELCVELGIPFEERPLDLADCLTGQEAMLTSTPYCVAGVSRINGVSIPWPGSVWCRLLEAWSARVGLDIQEQIERGANRPVGG